jgi:hypothetical protein
VPPQLQRTSQQHLLCSSSSGSHLQQARHHRRSMQIRWLACQMQMTSCSCSYSNAL